MGAYEEKLVRLQNTLSCREPDRIPLFDLFWKEFLDKWSKEKNESNIYEYYDMDLILCVPNFDPKVKSFELIESGKDYSIFKSGFGCTLKKADYSPMPGYLDFSVKSAEEYDDFILEDPSDERRYFQQSANILSSAGDVFVPSFYDQLQAFKGKIPTMGLVLEGQEIMWRIRGMEEFFVDLMLEKEKTKKFLGRLEEYAIQIGLNQIKMGVDFMFIGGDIAYDKGMFFSPDTWRFFFKPFLANMCREFKRAKPDIRLIYHGCGNAVAVFDELIECGIDAYQTLEVKAGLDVIELKKKYGNRLAFIGNIDAANVLPGDMETMKKDVLRRLNAAKGGGYIPMSDHSVPDTVSVENYDYYIQLIKDYGKYPLQLGEYDIAEVF